MKILVLFSPTIFILLVDNNPFYHGSLPPDGSKITIITKMFIHIVWQCTLHWPVVINKTIVQQNRIASYTTTEIC